MKVAIIGGGHNGLTAATLLAKGGAEVTVYEMRDRVGGLAAAIDVAEGYRLPGLLHDTRGLREWVIEELGLRAHGALERKPVRILAPSEDAGAAWLEGKEIRGDVSEEDRRGWGELRGFLDRIAPVVSRLLDRPPFEPTAEPWPALLAGLQVRRLGRADMMELLRVGPMCAADWMRDRLSSERLRAAVALPAMQGGWTGPWSAGTALNLVLTESIAADDLVGGPAALIDALQAAAGTAGVRIRTGARVERVELKERAVTGLVLFGGERVEADIVLSTCDPKTLFLELIGAHRLPERLALDIGVYRTRGTTAVVHLALSAPLELADGTPVQALRSGETLDDLERAFDPVKYGRVPERPALDVRVPSSRDASLCPEGHAVVSILAHHVPHTPRGGWTEELRGTVLRSVIAELSRYCPGVTDSIVASRLLTPADLEAEYGLSGGHIHHGEQAIDQLLFMRPSVDCSHYDTPIRGLYLGGSGSHPGGGITCVPGVLGAQRAMNG